MTRMAVLGIVLIAVEVLAAPSRGQALALSTSPAGDEAFLITPGVGIGKVKIGMPIAAVISILGAPKQVWRGRGGVNSDMYTWFKMPDRCAGADAGGGMIVYADAVGKVTYVTAYNDARYFLENGLHVGAGASVVQARMGEGARMGGIGLVMCDHLDRYSSSIKYPALGITFGYSETGVPWIGIYAPDNNSR